MSLVILFYSFDSFFRVFKKFIETCWVKLETLVLYKVKKSIPVLRVCPEVGYCISGLEVILKMKYKEFLKKDYSATGTGETSCVEKVCMRLVNGVITELLDPKVFYSRFSFLESGKQAIDIKHKISQLGNQKSSSDKK